MFIARVEWGEILTGFKAPRQRSLVLLVEVLTKYNVRKMIYIIFRNSVRTEVEVRDKSLNEV